MTRPPAMTSGRHDHGPVLLLMLLALVPTVVPVPAELSPAADRTVQAVTGRRTDHTTAPASSPDITRSSDPVGGYVRLRDGRRVTALRRSDVLQFRRLMQPERRWLERRVSGVSGVSGVSADRVLIAVSSALTAAAPPGELPDRRVTAEETARDEPPAEQEELVMASRSAPPEEQQGEEGALAGETEDAVPAEGSGAEESDAVPPAVLPHTPLDETHDQPVAQPVAEPVVKPGAKPVAEPVAEPMVKPVAEAAVEDRVAEAVAEAAAVDADDEAAEENPVAEAVAEAAAAAADDPPSPSDTGADGHTAGVDPAGPGPVPVVGEPVLPVSAVSDTGAVPPAAAHPTGGRPQAAAVDRAGLAADPGRPALTPGPGTTSSETVRREARGSAPTRNERLSTAEISAVAVGCVMAAAVVILGAVVLVQRTGVLKRRSILSEPPLDDTRLSYINASTDFSVSELGDEMTNLENLDNDSFLNSLESMTDSMAGQTCWSREVRHLKL